MLPRNIVVDATTSVLQHAVLQQLCNVSVPRSVWAVLDISAWPLVALQRDEVAVALAVYDGNTEQEQVCSRILIHASYQHS